MTLTFVYLRLRDFPLERTVSDGYFLLVEKLVELGIVDRARFVMECYMLKRPWVREIRPGFTIEKVPDLPRDLKVDDGDVVWIRGGWKPWFPWLEECIRRRVWLLYYGAGTGHQSWPHWDVVLDDCSPRTWVDHRAKYKDRLWLHFRKMCSPEFHYEPVDDYHYDFMLAANYVYGRKGQHLAYEAVRRYRDITGRPARMVLPGGWRGEAKTREFYQQLRQAGDVDVTGHLRRCDLADVLRRTRVFLHMGTSTQGDRSPIEAGRCGCRMVIAHKRRHATFLFDDGSQVLVPEDEKDETEVVGLLRRAIDEDTPARRQEIATYFEQNDGSSDRGLATMRRLFSFLKAHPQADRPAFRKEYECST